MKKSSKPATGAGSAGASKRSLERLEAYALSRQVRLPSHAEGMTIASKTRLLQMHEELESFAPKIHAMMHTIVKDDSAQAMSSHGIAKYKDMARMASKHGGFDRGRPPVMYLNTHFVFIPTMDGDTLFDGMKAENGALACVQNECNGTLAYAFRAFGIRLIPLNPRVRLNDPPTTTYNLKTSRSIVKYAMDEPTHVGGEKRKKTYTKKEIDAAVARVPGCSAKDTAAACVHREMAGITLANLSVLLRVMGTGADDDLEQNDPIDPQTSQKVCIALGGSPKKLDVLQKLGLKCKWRARFPHPFQAANREVLAYQGMLNSRYNKSAFQAYLDDIHDGESYNYKRGVLYTHNVVGNSEADFNKVFVSPLNQDGLIVRFIAVNLPRAVGLNIKPADVIHKPETPDNDGTDIQSSARVARSCPFHYDSLSECIEAQPGGVHRRCEPRRNVVKRYDYTYGPLERGLARLDEQQSAQRLLSRVLAEFSEDCRDHEGLHLQVEGGAVASNSILSLAKSKALVAGNRAAAQTGNAPRASRAVAACFKPNASRGSDRETSTTQMMSVVDPSLRNYAFLHLVQFMDMSFREFLLTLSRPCGASHKFTITMMINAINKRSNAAAMLELFFDGLGGEPLRKFREPADSGLEDGQGEMQVNGGTNAMQQQQRQPLQVDSAVHIAEDLRPDHRAPVRLSREAHGRVQDGLRFFFKLTINPVVEDFVSGPLLEMTRHESIGQAVLDANHTKLANMCVEIARPGANVANEGNIRKCLYMRTWTFLSNFVCEYRTFIRTAMLATSTTSRDMQDAKLRVFKKCYVFLRDVFDLCMSPGANNKTLYEQVPIIKSIKAAFESKGMVAERPRLLLLPTNARSNASKPAGFNGNGSSRSRTTALEHTRFSPDVGAEQEERMRHMISQNELINVGHMFAASAQSIIPELAAAASNAANGSRLSRKKNALSAGPNANANGINSAMTSMSNSPSNAINRDINSAFSVNDSGGGGGGSFQATFAQAKNGQKSSSRSGNATFLGLPGGQKGGPGKGGITKNGGTSNSVTDMSVNTMLPFAPTGPSKKSVAARTNKTIKGSAAPPSGLTSRSFTGAAGASVGLRNSPSVDEVRDVLVKLKRYVSASDWTSFVDMAVSFRRHIAGMDAATRAKVKKYASRLTSARTSAGKTPTSPIAPVAFVDLLDPSKDEIEQFERLGVGRVYKEMRDTALVELVRNSVEQGLELDPSVTAAAMKEKLAAYLASAERKATFMYHANEEADVLRGLHAVIDGYFSNGSRAAGKGTKPASLPGKSTAPSFPVAKSTGSGAGGGSNKPRNVPQPGAARRFLSFGSRGRLSVPLSHSPSSTETVGTPSIWSSMSMRTRGVREGTKGRKRTGDAVRSTQRKKQKSSVSSGSSRARAVKGARVSRKTALPVAQRTTQAKAAREKLFQAQKDAFGAATASRLVRDSMSASIPAPVNTVDYNKVINHVLDGTKESIDRARDNIDQMTVDQRQALLDALTTIPFTQALRPRAMKLIRALKLKANGTSPMERSAAVDTEAGLKRVRRSSPSRSPSGRVAKRQRR